MGLWSSLRTRVVGVAVAVVIVVGGAFVLVLDALVRNELEAALRAECAVAAESLAGALDTVAKPDGAEALRRVALELVGSGRIVAVVVLDPDRGAVAAEPASAGAHPKLGAWGQDGEFVPVLAVRSARACAAFHTSGRAGGTSLGVWVALDRRPLDQRVNRYRLFTLLLSLALLGTTMVVATLAAEGLVRPLEAISEAAASVGRGETEVRHLPTGPEEVQRLGRRVNRLADQLDATRTSLTHLAADLDRQVRERTREMETANRRLSELASTDPLTGLSNRRSFERDLERYLSLSRRGGEPLGVIMIDLDHFKRYNDACGHLSGDNVLRSVGAALQARARDYDVVARWGGDEFCILVPKTDSAGAVAAAKRFIIAINESLADLSRPDVSAVLNASAGVACFPEDGDQGRELVSRADAALYRAKALRGGKVIRYEAAADEPETV